MFKNQHRGLYPLALANTGERFGYYIMLATLVLYMQAKFGFDENMAGLYYSIFLAAVYFMPVVGGWMADKIGFGKCVVTGQLLMIAGYSCMSIPAMPNTGGLILMAVALGLISTGVGFFKGNLVTIFGNLYNSPDYAKGRESAFSLYYMANNIGAMFAPAAATKVTNVYMASKGFFYNANVPSLAHQYLNGDINSENLSLLQEFANAMGFGDNLAAYCQNYIDALSQSFNIGFAIAVLSLIVSAIIYFAFRPWFKHADYNGKTQSSDEKELTPKQTKDRIIALCMIFAVIIFFWMAFHQNGTSLTYFARDYTATSVSGWVRMSFNIGVLAIIAVMMFTLFGIFQAETKKGKTICTIVTLLLALSIGYIYLNNEGSRDILPQEFQQFNPFFVIALTPVSLAIFGGLAKKGKEPSAPMKIAIGMVVAAVGYLILVMCSIGLPDPSTLNGKTCATPVIPEYLISTYLVLTFAELLLSPMGLSFVSKVAPPKYKGLMMGLWFASGAIGNYLSRIPSMLWKEIPLWLNWAILMILCVISAVIMFGLLKKINEATK